MEADLPEQAIVEAVVRVRRLVSRMAVSEPVVRQANAV